MSGESTTQPAPAANAGAHRPHSPGTSPALERLRERAPAALAALERAAPLADTAATVLAASDFVLDALARDAALVGQLAARATERLAGAALPAPAAIGEESVFMAALRRWRRAELARIAWRDLAGWASLEETLEALSDAADEALRLALAHAEGSLQRQHGVPLDPHGQPQPLLIVAMGKLGGRELNFSSDIDLVLLYPQDGQSPGMRIGHHEYFTLLAQRLVKLIASPTEEGWVYRVDLRLRPFGDSGPTVCSAAALEQYLQQHGRDWERYAWVKARAVNALPRWRQLWEECIRPFVYRRYLDFGVLESLQDMKALIEREVRRRDLADDIKLGDGGIREIEFIVQSFQLIRGGLDRHLQHGSLRAALARLDGAKLLPPVAVRELDAAYVFLRRLENRLQMRADQQVHRLPAEPAERLRVAYAMGAASWEALSAQLGAQRACVSRHFRAVAFGSNASAPPASQAAALPLEGSDEALDERLAELGYSEAGQAAQALRELYAAPALRRLDESGRRRLRSLLAVLAEEAVATSAPLQTLRRLLSVLEAIGHRAAYFALLLHQRRPRERLVQIAAHGEFLTRQIAVHPLLLDELLDERLLENCPDRAALSADLRQRLMDVPIDDEEQQLERLCDFQRASLFRIALADLLAALPLMQVSDRLTELAELILDHAFALAWRYVTARYGVPHCGSGQERRPVRIAVIGYGKLGGRELSYSSDLDLVFLHDSTGAQQECEPPDATGPVLDNQVFFVRFAQRLVHLLTVHSRTGRLYEVDMRLRPSGRAGLLVTGIDAFADYQRQEAWTFEHQALLHARAVAGDAALRARFEALRSELLADSVRRDQLREEVRSMRARMRQEHAHAPPGQFDLKHDAGGIADIEFLAQYWALRWARRYPPVARYSDTIRQLESVGSADLVPQRSIDELTHAYRVYRSCQHHRALDGLGPVVPADGFEAQRAAVTALWERYIESPAAD